jgi:teichoic acid transport system permease protein
MTPTAALPETTDLVELHARPPFREYLAQIWQRRDYALRVGHREFRSKNMNNALGLLWFLLNPALSMLVYYIFFGLILGTDRGVENFIAFLAVGVLTYQYLQRTVTSASRTVSANVGIIRAIRFPRAILPLSDVWGQTLAHFPVVIVIYAVAIITGEVPTLKWILLFALIIPMAAFSLGAGLVLARMTTVFRDLQSFLPFAFRLIFYASGVLFSVEAFVQEPLYRALFALNPFYDFVVVSRWVLLDIPVSHYSVLGLVLWTVCALPVGAVVFWRGEPYGRA